MYNCRCITNVWKISVREEDVLNHFIDETIQENKRRSAMSTPSIMADDDDKAILHRYYCEALAELSALLARRTRRVGGNIYNETDEDTKMITTRYTMPMTANHEDDLVPSLTSHCLEFLVARLMEKWYGQGSNFGSEFEKNEIRSVLNYRRFPIERPFRTL